MSSVQNFKGVYSLLLTPFHSDKQIHWDAYDRYVDWQVSFQPNGLFAVCGTSEMKWLSRSERIELAQRAVHRAGKLPVLATANLEGDLTQHPDELREMIGTGVSGVVLVPPPGLGVNKDQLHDYFAELIQLSSVPVFIYEWPQTSPHLIPSDVFSSLVMNAGLKGIKDTTCTLEGISNKINSIPHDTATVYQANIPFLLDSLDAGAQGIMAVVSSCYGDEVVNLWKHRQDSTERKKLHSKLVHLDLLLRLGYPASSKYLVRERGMDIGMTTRWPIELNKEAEKALTMFARDTMNES